MGVRILHDDDDRDAVMYSSSTDWAFGPVFHNDDDHTASERAEAFCKWLSGRDPRLFDEVQLANLYMEWRAQEDKQWENKEKEELNDDSSDDR